MRSIGLTSTLITVFLLVSAPGAAASPRVTIKEVIRAVRTLPQTVSTEEIHLILDDYFDVDTFSGFALMDHWSKWSPEQQKTFKTTFTKRLAQNIQEKFEGETLKKVSNIKITAGNTSAKSARMVVSLLFKGQKYNITVLMVYSQPGWKIFDFDVEKTNFIRNYRAQFNKLLRTRSFNEFIEKIEHLQTY